MGAVRVLPSNGIPKLMAGFALLSIAFLIAGLGLGWGYGSIAWFGWLSAGAVTIVTLNCNRERILARVRP